MSLTALFAVFAVFAMLIPVAAFGVWLQHRRKTGTAEKQPKEEA